MRLTRAMKKQQRRQEMLEMAKVYKKSGSLYGFLVEISLMQFKHISTRMLTNPFVIYAVFSQRPIDNARCIAFPVIMLALGVWSWLIDNYTLKIIFLLIHFSLIFLQVWIYSRIIDAQRALGRVEILDVEEMFFKVKH